MMDHLLRNYIALSSKPQTAEIRTQMDEIFGEMVLTFGWDKAQKMVDDALQTKDKVCNRPLKGEKYS